MASVSGSGLALVGSHAGVAIGQDGPSQMGLEDLAMMRAVHDSTVLYPCDANQTARLVAAMAGLDGIRYLRTSRGASEVIYGPGEEFPVGGSKVLRSSGGDRLTLVAAGVTVPEALAAAEALDGEGIAVRVIDLYSVKPVDRETLRRAAEETGCLMTVEDHHPEGGLGDAVAEAFADGRPVPRLVRLGVRIMPGSASPGSSCTRPGSTPSRSRRPGGRWRGGDRVVSDVGARIVRAGRRTLESHRNAYAQTAVAPTPSAPCPAPPSPCPSPGTNWTIRSCTPAAGPSPTPSSRHAPTPGRTCRAGDAPWHRPAAGWPRSATEPLPHPRDQARCPAMGNRRAHRGLANTLAATRSARWPCRTRRTPKSHRAHRNPGTPTHRTAERRRAEPPVGGARWSCCARRAGSSRS
ncbi:hypothetical protein SHKM778_34350 [Streptomyces sp. KM77-8]|uniref:Transketolase C-terminal domain-containing protein n=1 Tax=Streptomyces haneummycinicus TaxID=3074435 RepID=A0AAT9HHT8_9ACTN